MSLSSSSKNNISIKKLVGKAHTSNALEAFNESKSTGITISADAVIANSIPTAPTSTNLYDITSSTVEYVRLVATPLNESIVDGKYHAFKLSLPNDYSSHDDVIGQSQNNSAGNAPFVYNQDLFSTNGQVQLVPPSFSDSYEAKVYYGGDATTKNDGTRIPLLDDRGWYLDYFNGILFQETPPDNADENPEYVEAYIYIGQMASDRFAEGNGGGGGASELDDLTDVTIGDDPVAQNQILVYTENNVFENKSFESTQLSDTTDLLRTTSSISSLSDVNDLTNIQDGNVLAWNSNNSRFEFTVPAVTYTDEEARDAVGFALTEGTHSGVAFVSDDVNNVINATVSLSDFSVGELSDIDLSAGTSDGKILKWSTDKFVLADDVDTNTQLSDEEVQDIVGAMVNGNTESDITVEYDDDNGKLNFSVDNTIARLNDPDFTGTPTAPTAEITTDNTQIATTNFVHSLIDSDITALNATLATTYQPLDAGLTSISNLTTESDKLIYTTNSDTYATSTLTAFARSLLDDGNAEDARVTLELGTAAVKDQDFFLLSDSGINDLSDVLISAPNDAHILIYDNDAGENDDKWKNVALTGDVTISNLGVTTIGESKVTNDKLLNSSITITDGTTSDSLPLGQTLTINPVNNETTVTVTADAGDGSDGVEITIGLPDDVIVSRDLTVSRNLVVTGDFLVNGSSSTISTTNLDVKDSIISLNNGIIGDDPENNPVANPATRDIGFFFDRGSLNPTLMFWDEEDDVFKLGSHSGEITSTSSDLGSANDGFSYEYLKVASVKDENGDIDLTSSDNTVATTEWVSTKVNTEVSQISINDLTDVDTSDKAEGKILKFNAEGNLVALEESVFVADTSSLWGLSDDGTELYPHGIIDGTLDTGMFAINLSAGSINFTSLDVTLYDILEELSSMNSYTPSTRDQANINDTYFEFDADGNIMPKAAV